MNIKNKTVFVSGGAGVIGLEMIPKLVERGAKVVVGDLKLRPKDFDKSIIYRHGDLNTLTKQELDFYRPDIFIHLAATFERSDESYEFWAENFLHNVQLSHHLMTLFKDVHTLRKVVFASSYLIYDQKLYQFSAPASNAISLKETDPVLPRNLVGAAKFSHEIELRFIDYFKSSQFSTVCARIFRGYGRNSRDVISRWIRDLLVGKGVSVYRPEGLFDYIYAADSAEGLIRLAECENANGIVNLGTGRARRVSDVVNILKKYFPQMQCCVSDSDILFEASQADMTKYKSMVVGWSPQYSLETAIPEIIEYERNRLNSSELLVNKPPKILISNASRKAHTVRAAQKAIRQVDIKGKVLAGDISEEVLTSYIADEFWSMPRTDDQYIEDLLGGCKQRGVTAVLPTRDGELLFWARNAEIFEQAGISVIVSKPEAVSRCIDKLAFAIFGKENAFPFIETSENIDDLMTHTFVVKERFGAGARSMGVNLNKSEAKAHAATLNQPIFQPFIMGKEISIDAWLTKDSRVKGLVMRTRELVLNGESQVSTTFRDESLEKQLVFIFESLGLSGPVVMQALIEKSGQIKIIECNARFGGASSTSIAAGLDSLYWSILEVQGENIDDYSFSRCLGEVKQVRIPTDIYMAV